MLKLAIAAAAIAGIMALLCFGGMGGAYVDVARVLLFVAIAAFLFFLVMHLKTRRRGGNDLGGPSSPY